MSSDAPGKTDQDEEEFDLALVHGETTDGEGARVLRARPGRLEAGEVRPLTPGRPLAPGGEVVRLVQRQGAPLYDVKVEYEVPAASPPQATRAAAGGPPQVATRAYRDSWERTFGASRRDHAMN
jgi:hypothetical protein